MSETAFYKDELEFSTTINFSEHDTRYQAVYTTQLYQTFFVLYARFQVKASEQNRIIERIDLLGVNYKGPVNLQVESTQLGFVDPASKKIILDVTLRGNGEGTFSKPDPLTPNLVVEEDSVFMVNRSLAKMNPEKELPAAAFFNGQFDSEFYERDGFMIAEKGGLFQFNYSTDMQDPLTGGMYGANGEMASAALGTNCPIGISKILFS